MLPSKSASTGPVPSTLRAKVPATARARLRSRFPWLLDPIGQLRELSRRPLRIERRGFNLHFVLGPPRSAETADPGDAGGGVALRRAFRELNELLSRHPNAPQMLPHLAYIERALRKNGSSAIPELPLSVLHRGLAQLNTIARNEPGEGLAELRRRLERAIGRRTREHADDRATQSAAVARDIDVSEASHSLFEEMERSWTGQVPQQS
jgi:hypothetical protein